MTTRRRVLVLYRHDDPEHMTASIRRHLRVLDGRGYEMEYVNALDDVSPALRLLGWDAIVLHTTFLTMRWHNEFYVWKWQFRWLSDSRAVKIAIPQDEYDHSEILDEWLYEIEPTVVLTNFDEDTRALLYPLTRHVASFDRCLTGYVDEEAVRRRAPSPPLETRPLDVVYRARRLPFAFGRHGRLKHEIAVATIEAATPLGLRVDISTDPGDAIAGEAWFEFLESGRATVGTESGSSVLDRRGEVASAIAGLLQAHPDATFAEISAKLPAGWDGHAFYAIGPRHLEAVMTKTPQLLVRGRYDGVLEADEHYVPVEADLSDLAAALERSRDVVAMRELAERAYADIVESNRYTYGTFGDQMAEWIESLPPSRRVPLEPQLRTAAAAADTYGRDALGRALSRASELTWQPHRPPSEWWRDRAPVWRARRTAAVTSARERARRAGYVTLATAAATRLTARTPEVRQLAAASARAGTAPNPRRLLAEVLHLNTMRKWHLAAEMTTRPELAGSTLTFVSTPEPVTNGGTELSSVWAEALAEIRGRRVRRVVWLHPDHEQPIELQELGRLAFLCPAETARLLDRLPGTTRPPTRPLE